MEHTIVIAGAGGIGRAVGLLLANYPALQATIWIGDQSLSHARDAAEWIKEGRSHPVEVIGFELPPTGYDGMEIVGIAGGVLLDCLPGSEAPRMARFALSHQMHYANLTEHVEETEQIVRMATEAPTGFVLQTGLAPGFVNLLARHLYYAFQERYGSADVDHVKMRVGALTDHTVEPHYYGFTWSPIGVATEYVKRSLVIENGEKVWKDALSDRERIIIEGREYEADLTSGGAADLPDAFLGTAKNLDYKTLRYPGHFDWVRSIIDNTADTGEPIAALENEMLKIIPSVDEDLIVIYASVSGRDEYGILRCVERSFTIRPSVIGGKRLRAIQTTTAAPMAECARMLLNGGLNGIVKQSEINTTAFFTGPFVDKVFMRDRKHQDFMMTV